MRFVLHLTNNCNMSCSYCLSPKNVQETMSLETGFRSMEFGAHVSPFECGVVFFGGEPLLKFDLIEQLVTHGDQIEKMKNCRFNYRMTTNGVLLDEKTLNFAVQHHISIAMSFDGIKQAHDRHRRFTGGASSYDFLLPRLKLLLKTKPDASVLLVINPDTAQFLFDSIRHLIELGCRSINMFINYDASWDHQDFDALSQQYDLIAQKYIDWLRQFPDLSLNPFTSKLIAYIKPECYKNSTCKFGETEFSIDPRGVIYPCVQFNFAGPESQWVIGNVYNGIDEESQKRILSASDTVNADCIKCEFNNRCNNKCGCLNFQTTGMPNKVSPILCQHEKMLIPIVDHLHDELWGRQAYGAGSEGAGCGFVKRRRMRCDVHE